MGKQTDGQAARSEDASPGSGRGRRRVRWLLLVSIVGLYVLSVPWYRDAEVSPPLWFGLPDWVAVALLCYVGVAILNAGAWMLTEVPDEEAPEEDRAREAAR